MADVIFLLDEAERVIGHLSNEAPEACPYYDDHLKEDVETGAQTYEFMVPANHPGANMIKKNGFIVREGFEGELLQFQVARMEETHTADGLFKYVFCEFAWSELNGEIIRPYQLPGVDMETAVKYALQDTRWKPGKLLYKGTRDLESNEYETALKMLMDIKDSFDVELVFRVEKDHNRITGRFVDMVEKRGRNRGLTLTFDQNMTSVKRIFDRTTVVTALIGLGRGDQSEKQLTFSSVSWNKANGDPADKPPGSDWVGDEDARMQWGVNGRHVTGVFTYDTTNPRTLLKKTWEELQRRKNGAFQYEADAVILNAAGWDWVTAAPGDDVLIQDLYFNPPVMLNARVIELDRSFTKPETNTATFGDYLPAISRGDALKDIQNTLIKKETVWQTAGQGANIFRGTTPPSTTDNTIWLEPATAARPFDVFKIYDPVLKDWVITGPAQPGDIGAETPEGAAQKAKEAEEAAKKYVQSRGENLVTNGTGLLRNNTNFSNFSFDGKEVYAGAGSFFSDKQNAVFENDEYIPVDPESAYRMSLFAKSTKAIGAVYFGIVPYDIDQKIVEPFSYNGSKFPIIELAQPLSPGDTIVYLKSTDGLRDDQATANHYHSFVLWGYQNSYGYEYPAGTYSRFFFTQAWNKGAIDRTKNTITLNKPFTIQNPRDPNGTFPAGTKLSATMGGGSFKYITASNVIVPTTWKRYDGEVAGIGTGVNQFPPGTALIRLLFLLNRNSAGGQAGDSVWINNIGFTNIQLERDLSRDLRAQTRQDVVDYAEKKIYRGAAIPAGASKGDLWIDERNTARPVYRQYDGVDWQALNTWTLGDMTGTVGNTQIAPGAVGTGNIQDRAITSAKIIALDAALITTGSLTGITVEVTNAGMTAAPDNTTNPVRIWAGASYSSRGSAPFRVMQNGQMQVSDIYITGGTIDVGDLRTSRINFDQAKTVYLWHDVSASDLEIKGPNEVTIRNAMGATLSLSEKQITLWNDSYFYGQFLAYNGAYISGGRTSINSPLTVNDYSIFNGAASWQVNGGTVYLTSGALLETSGTETGYCGIGGVNNNSGTSSAIAGVGVSFRMRKVYTPSSVSLSATSSSAWNAYAIDISNNGFWLYITPSSSNQSYYFWRGYYTA